VGSGALKGARVAAIMVFAEDTHAVSAWWAEAFGVEQVEVEPHPQGDFVFFETAGVELGFHAADPTKNPRGGSSVVYFSVPSLEPARARLIAQGAEPHRGPLALSEDRTTCQLRDPFGNVFGLDGPP
jgi:predicted enzyme related to lactoylglutathione lyase